MDKATNDFQNPLDGSRDPFAMSYANPNLLDIGFEALPGAPFNSAPSMLIGKDISRVAELAAITQPGSAVIPVQNAESEMVQLRAMFPFLAILPWPTVARNIFLATANLALDVDVPSGAVLMKLHGTSDYYVNMVGRAVRPNANDADMANASLYKPEDGWWYVGDRNQFSVVSPAAAAVVTAAFIMRPSR